MLAAILRHGYRPRVIIVEACFQLPSEVDAVVLYHRAHRWDFSCYHSASVRAYHALAQRYQYSVVHAMAPDLYWVRNDVLTSSVGLDAYDTTNDAEAHVKAGSLFESTGCLRVWQTRGYMKSTQAMSSYPYDISQKTSRPSGSSRGTPGEHVSTQAMRPHASWAPAGSTLQLFGGRGRRGANG